MHSLLQMRAFLVCGYNLVDALESEGVVVQLTYNNVDYG